MDADLTARKLLGTKVRQARRAAGFSNTAAWADRVGRSDRIVLGLERGEAVGADTYAAVADALGWPLERIYSLLNQESEEIGPASPSLTTVSDEDLAREVLRRMKKAGEGHDRDAPSIAEQSIQIEVRDDPVALPPALPGPADISGTSFIVLATGSGKTQTMARLMQHAREVEGMENFVFVTAEQLQEEDPDLYEDLAARVGTH